MTSDQKARLRYASLCLKPLSASTCKKQWDQARADTLKALKGRNLQQGLKAAVFIESCNAMDHYLVRMPRGTPTASVFTEATPSAGAATRAHIEV